MIGTISIEGLEIECVIGIHPHERTDPQIMFVDIALDCDIAAAVASDSIADTIDYVTLADYLRDLAHNGRFQLLETYAERAVNGILERWPAVRKVAVKAMKPEAIPTANWTAVRVERSR